MTYPSSIQNVAAKGRSLAEYVPSFHLQMTPDPTVTGIIFPFQQSQTIPRPPVDWWSTEGRAKLTKGEEVNLLLFNDTT